MDGDWAVLLCEAALSPVNVGSNVTLAATAVGESACMEMSTTRFRHASVTQVPT